MADTIPPVGTRACGWVLDTARRVKAYVSIPVAVVGKILTVENGEEILKNGDADIIGYGRSLLCDPDIAAKAQRNEPIRSCLNCNKGCDVSIIEMMDKIAGGESSTILPTILADFAKHHVKQYVNTKVSAIENDGKVVRASENGRELRIDCDMVVMAVGSRKNTFDASEVTVPVCYVGDCSGERTAGIMEAVRSGYKAANEI